MTWLSGSKVAVCTTSFFKHWCCVSRILGSADPPPLLRLWCHRITVSYLVVMVHQQLGRDWLTLPSLSGLKSCDSDLNCKWMGHHGKANAAVKNGRKRSSSAVFLDLPPDRFCIICIWTLASISSNLYSPIHSQRANPRLPPNHPETHLCETFAKCSFKKQRDLDGS